MGGFQKLNFTRGLVFDQNSKNCVQHLLPDGLYVVLFLARICEKPLDFPLPSGLLKVENFAIGEAFRKNFFCKNDAARAGCAINVTLKITIYTNLRCSVYRKKNFFSPRPTLARNRKQPNRAWEGFLVDRSLAGLRPADVVEAWFGVD